MLTVLFFGNASLALTLTNGDFETGDFTGWSEQNFNNGGVGPGQITTFNTTGSGASQAATFQVGSSYGIEAGESLQQAFTVPNSGTVNVSADVAAENPGNPATGNGDGGTFILNVDGLAIDSFASGSTVGQQTLRSHLAGATHLSAGTHTLRIDVERIYTSSGNAYQYVDNVAANFTPDSVAPALSIFLSSTNTAIVSWPYPSTGFSLQQNWNLSTTNWVAAPEVVNNNALTNYVIVNPPAGNQFYRLKSP